jgi:hypothetical protein
MTVGDQRTIGPVPSAANGAVRQRRVDGGRNRVIKLKLDDADYRSITDRANECKLSVQRFLVSCALSRRFSSSTPPRGPVPAPRIGSAASAELVGIRRLTANLANNINQIARVLNSGGTPSDSIPAAAEAVRRVMIRLDSVLAAMAIDPSVRTAERPIPAPSGSSSVRGIPSQAPRITPEAPT